ncbi:MAG: hypothetical protein ABW161_04590 [Candidatus Thiodiazotropha sp.]
MNKSLKSISALVMGLGIGMGAASSASAQSSLEEDMKERGLTQKDLLAAAKTYTPTGGRDEYLAFSSGGAERPGHRIRCAIHEDPEVHCGVYSGTLAGLWLR